MLIRSFGVVAGLILGSAAIGPTAAAAPAHRPLAVQLAKDFLSAWRITRGKGATVAVLSTGVDSHVASLAGAVTEGPDYARFGAVRKVEGTLVASTIAGTGPTIRSPFGIRGLAPDAHILSVRVYPDSNANRFFTGTRAMRALAKGIRYAARHGASVIDVDVWVVSTKSLESAVNYALSRGAVIVAPVGVTTGTFRNTVVYPSGYPGVIGVNPVDLGGHMMKKYGMRNGAVLVSAPGIKLPATGPHNEPWLWWGEGPATAWVASVAALVKSKYPHLSPALVGRAIARSTRRHPPGGFNQSVGFGVINPAGALAAAGALAKLTSTARPGQGAVALSAHLGPQAKEINAVRLSLPLLGGSGAAVVVGFGCVALAVILWVRRRRQAHAGPSAPAGWSVGQAAPPYVRPGYGPPPAGYGPPPAGYGQPPGYGQPTDYGPTPAGPPPAGYSPPAPGGYGSAPPGGYGSPPGSGYGRPPQGGYDSPPGGGYGSAPPGGYGSPPESSYGSAPHGGYGSEPGGGYGSAPHGGYGSASHGGYGSEPQGRYGSTPESDYESAFGSGSRSPSREDGDEESHTPDR